MWKPAAICFLSFIFLTAAAGAADRGDVTLYMDFYYGDTKIADVTETLRFVGDEYEINSNAAAVGLAKLLHGDVTSMSRGKTDNQNGLLMTAYAGKRGPRRPQSATFDGNLWRLQRGEEIREEKVEAPVFDYLTAVYRSYVLGAPTGGTLFITNGWRLNEQVYTVGEKEEIITTPMGDIPAILLLRKSERGERRIWLAPSLNYLPIKIHINDKTHVFQSIIKQAILPLR